MSDTIAAHGRADLGSADLGSADLGSAVGNRAARESRDARQDGTAAAAVAAWDAPDGRRLLQLALGASWLLDAVLQGQSSMFTRAFARMLADSASGNPAFVASPITWSAHIIGHHVAAANLVFATVQLLLALGIALRPTVKIALAASVAWSLAVWWLGEGLGSVLTGNASPVSGAPGAVIIYALLGVLLWPARTDRPAAFAAGRSVGAPTARVLWLVLWGSLSFLSLQQAVRSPRGLSSMISGMAAGEPGWLAVTDTRVGALLARHGLAASIVLAVTLGVIAAGVYLPTRAARAAIVLAVFVALAIWVAEALGGVLTGSGTDPGSGPLLALLAVAYWPSGAVAGPAAAGRDVRRAVR
ncbi:MAG TPA: hypothetical protein VK162_09375 [Streptosporangiaceae bacterium]|nr:hypothetical protein [Streptosporangiaceae bacterium]